MMTWVLVFVLVCLWITNEVRRKKKHVHGQFRSLDTSVSSSELFVLLSYKLSLHQNKNKNKVQVSYSSTPFSNVQPLIRPHDSKRRTNKPVFFNKQLELHCMCRVTWRPLPVTCIIDKHACWLKLHLYIEDNKCHLLTLLNGFELCQGKPWFFSLGFQQFTLVMWMSLFHMYSVNAPGRWSKLSVKSWALSSQKMVI